MPHVSKMTRFFARAAVLGLVVLTGACTGIGTPTPVAPSGSPMASSATQTSPASQSVAASPSNAMAPSAGAPLASPPASPGASPTPAATPPNTGISEEQAIAAVKAFAPKASDLRVVQSETVAMGPAFRVQSADVVAEVDAATGRVTMFLDNAAMPTSTVVKITKEAALAAAIAWLAAHGVSTDGLSPTTTMLDHGAIQEYEVVFLGRVNGARVPHRVEVSIDPATGAIYAFALFDRPFAPPPSPVLTAVAAAKAARDEEKDAGAKVTSSDLAIDFDAAGGQVLVYELDLTRSDGFYVKLRVDALSGAVTVMGRG